MTPRERKYIARKKRRSVRMRFDNNPDHDIVIPDIRKFRGTMKVSLVNKGEYVVEDTPTQIDGEDWVYKVKIK